MKSWSNTVVMQSLLDTFARDEVCELPGPARVEARDVVVPHDAPAAVAHPVDFQVAASPDVTGKLCGTP